MGGTKKVWIDCDAGVDDAQAIILALASPSVEVIGISTVHGNVDAAKVAVNVARVLTLCERIDVPFYLGADEPLLGQPMDASFFHGLDGLGDKPHVYPSIAHLKAEPAGGFAAWRLCQASQRLEGELIVIALGPLTNIALACKLDPNFHDRVNTLYVMGGAEQRGNVTPIAEFNFHCDPEAAHLVLKKFKHTVLITWECTHRHAVAWETVDKWLSKGTPKSRFLAAVMAKSIAYEKGREGEACGWIACDPLAAAVAICEGVTLKSEHLYCAVELHGSLTRGQSVFDWMRTLNKTPNVELVKQIDLALFEELLSAAFD